MALKMITDLTDEYFFDIVLPQEAGKALGAAADACNDIINSAHRSCSTELNTVFYDCQDFIKAKLPTQIQSIGKLFFPAICAGSACTFR